MTLKATIITAVVVVLALTGLGYLYTRGVERETALRTQLEYATAAQNQAYKRSESDRKVLIARQAVIAAQARKLAAQTRDLNAALQRNKSWSDTDVPPDVQKSLAEASDGLPGPSGPVSLRD
jgi:Tfp pilus assembly protein PilV